jgi:F-type H+-transporting ATPase subunit delta
MADLHTLARPYAKAAFELAQEGGALPAWSDSLKALAAAVADPQIAVVTNHPALSPADLGSLLISALGDRLDAQGRNFVRLLADNGRVEVAPAIAVEFERLRSEAERRVEVEITTAVSVDDAQRKSLSDAVRKRLGLDAQVAWKVDEALIAGALIRAGDLVIDGSAAGELDRLRQVLAA